MNDLAYLLAGADDESFRRQLDRYLDQRRDPCPPDLEAALFSESLVDRTFYTLLAKASNVTGQIAAATADLDAARARLHLEIQNPKMLAIELAKVSTAEATKRAARTRHLTSVNIAISRARRVREQLGRVEASEQLEDLRGAIRRHRDATADDPRPADGELHALIG